MTPREQELEAQVQTLRAQINDLTGADHLPRIAVTMGVSGAVAKVTALLIARRGRAVTKNSLYELVFQHANGDGPGWKCVDVALCKARARLTELGVPFAIETVWGIGYRATDDLLAWADEVLDEGRVAA